jgi:phage shock protein E
VRRGNCLRFSLGRAAAEQDETTPALLRRRCSQGVFKKLEAPTMAQGPRFEKLASAAQAKIREVSAAEAGEIYETGGLLIDVREADEFSKEHAVGAKHLSRGVLELKIEELEPNVDRPIVLYCGGGKRSALAAESLQRMGYENVSSLADGFKAWKAAGLERICRVSSAIVASEVS